MEINFTADIDVAGLAQDVADLIDAESVAKHIDVHDVASNIDVGDLAQYFETNEIAECFDVSDIISDIADGFSTRDIARNIDMEDLAEHVAFQEIADRIDLSSVADLIDMASLSGYVMRATGGVNAADKITALEERIEQLTKQLVRVTDAMVTFGASAMHMDEDEDALSFPLDEITEREIALENAKSGYATPTWTITEVPYI